MSKFTLDKLKELKERVEHVVVPSSPTRDSEFLECQEDIASEVPDDEIKLVKSKSTDSQESGSWLTNVKGKLSKAVEKADETQCSEVSENVEQEPSLVLRRLSHSVSEASFPELEPGPGSRAVQRPHSQIFEFDPSEREFHSGEAGGVEPAVRVDTPSKSRKKFAIPSIFSRTGTPNTPDVGSPGRAESETPKRSVRSLFFGKSQSDQSSASPPKIPADIYQESDQMQVTVESSLIEPNKDSTKDSNSSEVEEGLDATELASSELGDELTAPDRPVEVPGPAPPVQTVLQPPALLELCHPILIAIVAVLNMVLPSWLGGFVSGLVISCLLTYWVISYLYPSPSSSMTPDPHIRVPGAASIEIHEPAGQVQFWMNLLPPAFQPYDVDSYEVRNTVSVRVTVEHHMLKIEYPEWNLPKRLNTDEVLPADIKFLYHSDHVDLTKAKISLLPEGIAGKRLFSKKYPIEIKPEGLSVGKQPTSLIKQSKSMDTDFDSDDDEAFKDVVETPIQSNISSTKVLYLFARADREKEDIYKSFLDAHFFLTDTVLDVARREGAITEGIDSEAGGRQTVRERKTKFNEFMANVLEHQKHDADQSDACLNFLNVFLNRIFYDIHKSEQVKALLKTRVYNKLLKIKITQWFKWIELGEINMGKTLPKVCRVSSVHQDERGLWVEMGLEYDGIASATIETCGLIIGEENSDAGSGAVHLKALLSETESALPLGAASPDADTAMRKVSSRIEAATNSDEEDSAEEDSDSQELPVEQAVAGSNVEAGSLTRSRWWEVVGNSDIVKSGINKLSNSEWFKEKTSKKMTLQLEVTSLRGVIVLNIPPPPSDRLWYGFKVRPDLGLRIVPFYDEAKLGSDNTMFSRAINKTIDIVVNRLKEEIMKFVLLPNMDDIPIKVMDPFSTTNAEI